MDEHRICIGDVDTAFDDCRADQNVDLSAHEAEHRRFEFARSHLSVSDVVASFRNNLLQPSGNIENVVNAVVDEKDLPVAI